MRQGRDVVNKGNVIVPVTTVSPRIHPTGNLGDKVKYEL